MATRFDGSNRFGGFAWGVLLFTVAVVLWGAYVRATGSGAGCGSHWPFCNGEVIPRSPTMETIIEYTHRLTSGLAFLLVLGLTVWAFRVFPRRHPVRWATAAAMFFMITEALVGAGLVLFGLVAQNDSFARAWALAFHLVNTFLLLGCLALSAWWSRLRREASLQRPRRNLALPLAILGGLLLIGVSGAVAALGDTLFPSLTVSEALARDFAPDAHLLIQLRVYHPVLALVLGIVVILGAFRLMGSETGTSRFALGVLLIVVYLTQLGLGLLNLALLAPVWLQLVHLAVADTVWITAVLLTGSSLITGENGEN